jgi:hypothetical protein
MNEKEQDLDVLEEEDQSISQEEESGEPLLDKCRIFTDKSDPPVSGLYEKWKLGDLDLKPIFQRRPVWDPVRQSRLVESVMLEVPLPVIYLAETQDGREEVIDGQQRLTALFSFLDNKLELRGLKAIKVDSLKVDPQKPTLFNNLNRAMQRQIRNYSIRTITFKKESDDHLRFEIFERLNTGAVPLNNQELRNCIYRGNYNDLLIELSRDSDYRWLMGLKTDEKRMRDVEYVLRFAAFYHATYLKYKPSMAHFLSEDMRKHQKISQEEEAKLRKAFKTSVTLIRSLLGENAFKRYYRGDTKSPHGRWETKKFNASLYDILMYSFADADKNHVMANLDTIREALIVLMTENPEFIDSIELSTSAARIVQKRFDLWRLTLDAILAQAEKQPRCFSRDLKKELYNANPTCSLCNNRINDPDDAAVDHIEMYWLGGKTIPENARLTHRYCNWARPKHE